jgi:hypothetical protein
MRELGLLLLAAAITLPAFAVKRITVDQLDQALGTAHDRPDLEVGRQLLDMELTERLNAVRLSHWEAQLPGTKSQQAMIALADASAFLDPPKEEILAIAAPDPTTLRQMMVMIVNYVNKTVRELPSLTAMRETTGFEDSPQEDVLGPTGVTSYSYQPLHLVSTSSVPVVYRDRREETDEGAKKAGKRGPQVQGLKTSGEFGPILSAIVADALQGTITFSRWEQGARGPLVVFHYAVPREKSHYVVQFCCVSGGVYFSTGEKTDWHVYSETAAYHGQIAFDPADGTIFRMMAEAEFPPDDLVSRAAMLVDYAPVEIGGKSFICPAKSVSILLAHTTQPPPAAHSVPRYKGPPKTFLNDVSFGQYHQFRVESRILMGSDAHADRLPNASSGQPPSVTPTLPH